MDELMKETAETGHMVVHVEKAELPLKPGESTDEFRQRLQDLVSEHFKALDIGGEIKSLWANDLYPDSVVVCAYWQHKRDASLKEQAHPEGNTYFQVGYMAKGDAITFGDTAEVERRVTWVRKTKVEKRDEQFWEGVL